MDTHPKDPSTLTRRHTIPTTTTPTHLTIPNSKPYHTSSLPPTRTNGAVFPPPPLDLSLSSISSSSSSASSLAYTSLRDILPSVAASSINSPTPSGAGGSAYEVPIRNRLVKQAACAYLQPMSSSPDTSPGFLRQLWLRLSSCRNPFSACLRFLTLHVFPAAADALRRILRSVRVPVNRSSSSL